MARDRAGLARLAIRHAKRQGLIQPGATISLIGDAPSDILAAKANNVRAVAVHTGISTREELMAHEPDLLVEDLSAVRLEMLLG
jgi:phosphoglycolate phosphatase-like HAD superfamily hydrolase